MQSHSDVSLSMWGLRAVLLITTFCLASVALASDLPEGWGPVGSSPDTYLTEAHPNAGRDGSGLRIRSIEPGDAAFGGVGQRIDAEDYLGQRVRLSGYIRAFNVVDKAGLWMRVDPADGGRPIAFDNMYDRPVTGSSDWQHYDVVLNISEEAGHIMFGALLSGEGEIHVDNLSLEVVDETVPVTDMMAEPESAESDS